VYSDEKIANRNVGDFGWEIAHEAVSRRPLIPLYSIVAYTHMYTYDASVWDLSIVQGHLSPNLVYDRNFFNAVQSCA
jgi:hypothetical protein